jgi:hypothetical protein
MKISDAGTLTVRATLTALVLSTAAQAEQMWQRSSDWIPGTPGSVSGTPGPSGPPIWVYEYTTGGGHRLSSNPWFTTPTQMMVWDDNWYGTNVGVWAAGNDLNPPVDANRLAHNMSSIAHSQAPLIRFNNPNGFGTVFTLAGTLKVVWDGLNGVGYPTPVDVMIGVQDATKSNTNVLLSTTVLKPNNFPSVGDFVTLPVQLTNVMLAPGESIIVSHRARNSAAPGAPGGWIHMHDTISLVPSPGIASVMGLGALAMMRRRRR